MATAGAHLCRAPPRPKAQSLQVRLPSSLLNHYYASPWWLAAPVIALGLGLAIAPQVHRYSGRSGHVQWCHNRFRSHTAATDSDLDYDGPYHRCNSPY